MDNQYKLFATDFDNTLVPLGETAPRKAVRQAVRNLKAQGGSFVICTGRSLYALTSRPKLLGGLKYDYAVCNNGAHVVDAKGETLYQNPLTYEEMYALVDFCEDYDYPLQFAFSDGYYAYVGYDSVREMFDKLESAGTGLGIKDGEDQDRHLTELPDSAFVMFPPDGLARFQEKYGYQELEFIPISNVYELGPWCSFDIMHKGVNKGAGLKGLCESLNLPLEQVVAAGDGHNDIELLQTAGLGCAMGNAPQDVKDIADRVLPDVKQEGIAPLLNELWPAAADEAAGARAANE